MLYWLKQLVPEPILAWYHFVLAKLSAHVYRHPSNRLIVIGVTGTNGKSSTVQFIAQLLTELGHRVGYTTTAGFSIAGKEIENKLKMTMPGRFYLQQLIQQMVQAGCEYAIIETSSQGIDQFRHLGINYDEVLITNLTPEHIEAHGGFENYKRAKGKLFAHLTKMPRKKIAGQEIQKTSIVNADDEHVQFFADFPADRHLSFGWQGEASEEHLVASGKERLAQKVHFKVNDQKFALNLHADFQHKNALAAIAAVYGLGFSLQEIAGAAKALQPLLGRFELVQAGQPFYVIVDYAYEPYAIQALLDAVKELQPRRIIGVHGSAGGGRDVARRPKIGRLAGQEEDYVVVTNEDPYDEDPLKIIEEVAAGAKEVGKVEGDDLFIIEDRTAGIRKAIELAGEGDAVILTGKGNEPVMAVAQGKKAPWSDKKAALQALARRGYSI